MTEENDTTIADVISQLKAGEMEGNYERLLHFYGVEQEEDVKKMIDSFTISVDGTKQKTMVGDGTYKSAVLLLSLADLKGIDFFKVEINEQTIIRGYFPRDMVKNVIDGSDTSHPTLALLLSKEPFFIEINRPDSQ